jgi:hypothetical protein
MDSFTEKLWEQNPDLTLGEVQEIEQAALQAARHEATKIAKCKAQVKAQREADVAQNKPMIEGDVQRAISVLGEALVGDSFRDGTVDPQGNFIADKTDLEDAVTSFQNEVWASLEKYSTKLGWGLTGTQPECWTLLDYAIAELVKRKVTDKQIIRILTRFKCGCYAKDCAKHGAYDPNDHVFMGHVLNYNKIPFES